jgi:hypothetical protein
MGLQKMARTTGNIPNKEMISGIDASVEDYKAVSGNSTARFRDLSNLYTDMSGIPEFTQEDYYAFRPGSRIPSDFSGLMRECNYVYESNGLIWNIINLMTDFTIKGIRLVHKNKRQEAVFQDWFQRIGGIHISERFVNLLYRLGNVVVQRYTASVRDADEIAVAKPNKPDREGLPKMFIPRKNEIPWKYVFINPGCCELIGGPLSSFVDKPTYGLKLPEELKNLIKAPKTPEERKIVESLPKAIREAASSNKPYPLEEHRTIVYHFKKDDWYPWARPMISPILDELRTYEKLRFADQCILDGAASKIRIFKIGNLEHKVPPKPAYAQKLSSLLETNVGGGTINIVWGPDLEIVETENSAWNFLGEEKYKPTLDAIYSTLGVPRTLTASTGGSGSTTSNYMSLKTLTERLSYGRALLIDFWEKEIAIFQKAMGFRTFAEVEFDQTIIANEDTEKQLLLQLCDRNLISEEMLQIRFGMKPHMEKVRLNREKRERESGTRVRKGGQWFDPEPEQKLKQIALQSGQITPGQAGLEVKPPDPTEISNMKKLPLMKKAAEPKKQPGQVGKGRPPGKKDSQKRKTKKYTPRTKGMVTIWANAAQNEISNILNPLILKLYGKANFRKLTTEEFNNSERIKFNILCGLEPHEEITPERVKEELDKGLLYPAYLEALREKVLYFKEIMGKEPTIDEIRFMQSEVYSQLVDISGE